jgi:hypothetical protein
MTQGSIARVAPLAEELSEFCKGHDQGEGAAAATRMLTQVRELWPDVAAVEISDDADAELECEVLALRIVHDVGIVAERLQRLEVMEALAWSRANLILDLERYLRSVGVR